MLGSSSTHVHQIHQYVSHESFPIPKVSCPKMLLFETKVQEALIEAGSVMRPAVDVRFLGIKSTKGFAWCILLGVFWGKKSAKITLPEN